MPQILKNMGFTSTKAQLMTAPPYACGAISALLSSLLADKFTWRMPFIVSSQLLLIIAFSILFALVASVVALPATPCAACLAYCGNGALDSQSCRLCEEDNCA